MGKYVNYELSEEIAIVKIDNPPVNAFKKVVVEDFIETIKMLQITKLRALIITGAGTVFQAGGDIKMFLDVKSESDRIAFASLAQGFTNQVTEIECPTIAAINGPALGGGVELALACDIRIASTTATFGLPEVGYGLLPGAGGTSRLPRLIGPGRAKLLILTGMVINAMEALSIGLVDKVVEADLLMQTVTDIAKQIAKRSPLAVKTAKKVINAGLDVSLSDALMIERKGGIQLFSEGDVQEGVSAFLEKRKPNFINK